MGLIRSFTRPAALSPALPRPRSGRYYGPYNQRTTASTTANALSANKLYAVWFDWGRVFAFDRIAAEITTGSAGKNFRLGVYLPDGANGDPGSLLVDSGDMSAASIAVVVATVSGTYPAGGAWLALCPEDGTMQFRHLSTTVRTLELGASTGGLVGASSALRAAHVYGALPATFPAIEAIDPSAAPIISLRAV